MKGKKARLVVVLVAVVAAGVLLWRSLADRDVGRPGTISGNGTVEATETEISSRIAGRLLRVVPREGDEVVAGQEVATLDPAEIKGQAEQARGNLAASEATLAEARAGSRPEEIRRLEAQAAAADSAVSQVRARLDLVRAGARAEVVAQVRAAVSQAEVSLADAEREFERVTRLEREGAVPGRDLDQAGTRRDASRAGLEQARKRLAEVEAGARPEEVREVEAAVALAESQAKAARAALDLARAGARRETIEAARARVEAARGAVASVERVLAETTIAAPSEGVVTLRSAEPGETVTPGQPIIRVADLRRVWLRVYVPEPLVGKVKTGQRAEVTVDSYPGKTYPGTVTEIAQKPEFTPKNVQTKEERVKLVFGVKVEVDNPDRELKPGMPADAVILTGP